jgi:hypothetical protein
VQPSKAYKKREGFVLKVPVEAVGSTIEALKDEHPEGITPEMVVEAAKDPESPIHAQFTWDESEAARKQWRTEARYLMSSYEVTVISQTSSFTICPASVRVITPQGDSVFESPIKAMSIPERRDQVLRETGAQLRGIADRLARLQGLSPVILVAVRNLIKTIDDNLKRKAARRGRAKAEAENHA